MLMPICSVTVDSYFCFLRLVIFSFSFPSFFPCFASLPPAISSSFFLYPVSYFAFVSISIVFFPFLLFIQLALFVSTAIVRVLFFSVLFVVAVGRVFFSFVFFSFRVVLHILTVGRCLWIFVSHVLRFNNFGIRLFGLFGEFCDYVKCIIWYGIFYACPLVVSNHPDLDIFVHNAFIVPFLSSYSQYAYYPSEIAGVSFETIV